jgi:hypothetical protein
MGIFTLGGIHTTTTTTTTTTAAAAANSISTSAATGSTAAGTSSTGPGTVQGVVTLVHSNVHVNTRNSFIEEEMIEEEMMCGARLLTMDSALLRFNSFIEEEMVEEEMLCVRSCHSSDKLIDLSGRLAPFPPLQPSPS